MRERIAAVSSLLRNRDFTILWVSDLLMTFGDRIHRVALANLIYTLTGSLLDAGIAFIAAGLPDLVLGPAGGVLIDRFDRRRLMVFSDIARVIPVLLLPIVAPRAFWAVYLLLFVINAFAVFYRPAKLAAIPSVVPPESLNQANSFSSMIESVGDLLGYPVAGFGIGLLTKLTDANTGLLIAFGTTAFVYGLSAMLLSRLRLPAIAQHNIEQRTVGALIHSGWQELRDGLYFLRQHAVVRTNTIIMLLGPLSAGIATPLLIGYAWTVFSDGTRAYALLNFGIGVGCVLGAMVLSLRELRRLGSLVILGLLLMGGAFIGLAWTHTLWTAIAMMAVSGIGNMLVLIPSVTIVHRCVPGQMLGRIFTLRSALIFAVTLIANGIGGWVGDALGARLILAATGITLLVSALLAGVVPASRAADQLMTTPQEVLAPADSA